MDRRLFETRLVSYLLEKGFVESAPPKVENSRTSFFFKDTPELEGAIHTFYDGKPMVNAQVYSYHLRRLNILVAQNKKEQGGGKND